MLKKMLLGFTLSLILPLTAHADEKQIQCLAQNAYHEARGQGPAGMIAVTNVVMNRVKDKRFPKTPCAVIKQRTRKTCQFSWVCANSAIKDRKLYGEAVDIVRRVYYNMSIDNTRGALYFHERHARPSWSYKMRLTVNVGSHKFYKG